MDKPTNSPVQHNFTSTDEAYRIGFGVGLAWTDDWTPGGPHVYGGKKYPEDAKFSKLCNERWRAGFIDGKKSREATE